MNEEKANDGLPEEEFSALMKGIGNVAPLLGGLLRPPEGRGEDRGGDPCARREAFLCALKPYLSADRCAAVDYLIRLGRVGDALKALR
jgi:hypothetical protein